VVFNHGAVAWFTIGSRRRVFRTDHAVNHWSKPTRRWQFNDRVMYRPPLRFVFARRHHHRLQQLQIQVHPGYNECPRVIATTPWSVSAVANCASTLRLFYADLSDYSHMV